MIGTVKSVEFTHGSPFGHQNWTIEVDGTDRCFAMWEDLRSDTWAKTGEKVELKLLGDQTCSMGRCTLTLRNCAEIVRIIK
jgi:hypothetical protein